MNMLFYGNLPIGAGLSSSASIEVVTGFAINELFDAGLSKKDIALLCQQAENNFIGVSCGIMDQVAVALGKKGNAMLINCDTVYYEYVPFDPAGLSLVIINTNKQRVLSESKYNERFAECGLALKLLKQELPADNLCDIGLADFDTYRYLLSNEVLEKRALHVISENARVKDAVLALQMRDMETFGKLMFASHQSLKELYEVSGKELDTIVDFCKDYPGCIGARMTGAGFGGCAIALVAKNRVNDFSVRLPVYYKERIGYNPEIFISVISDGVEEIKH
jgi:galactokinase